MSYPSAYTILSLGTLYQVILSFILNYTKVFKAFIMARRNRGCREATGQFLEKRHPRMKDCEVLSQASFIFGLREAPSGLDCISAPLNSRLYESWQREIAVLIVDESHDCRNSESLYCEVVQSLRHHHILMLTGAPIYNDAHDLIGQTMLLPGGDLFKSLEHFRSIFCPDDTFNPQGAWLDLFRRLYRALIIAHPKNIFGLPDMRTETEEFRLTDRITILRIDTLVARFNYLLRIDHHCKDGSALKNMFIEAMGVLSKGRTAICMPAAP